MNSKYSLLTIITMIHPTDKGISDTESHLYTEVYNKYFYKIRGRVQKVLEIGIYDGHSLKLWRDYFPNATIYGIDNSKQYIFNEDNIKCMLANQSKKDDLKDVIKSFGGDFDIIIDDGSHVMRDQQISLSTLFPYLKAGGFYAIEDLHSCFMPGYGQTSTESNLTIKLLHDLSKDCIKESLYMTEDEISYINENCKDCTIYSLKPTSIMAIIEKKNEHEISKHNCITNSGI